MTVYIAISRDQVWKLCYCFYVDIRLLGVLIWLSKIGRLFFDTNIANTRQLKSKEVLNVSIISCWVSSGINFKSTNVRNSSKYSLNKVLQSFRDKTRHSFGLYLFLIILSFIQPVKAFTNWLLCSLYGTGGKVLSWSLISSSKVLSYSFWQSVSPQLQTLLQI